MPAIHLPYWFSIAAVLMVLAAILLRARAKAPSDWPFISRRILSPVEQIVYGRLIKTFSGYIVLAQVSMSALVDVASGVQKRQERRNQFTQKYVDFVICKKDFGVLAIIEIDDATHARPDRVRADATKDRILAAAGLRLLRWQAKALPDDASMRAQILDPPAPNVSAA